MIGDDVEILIVGVREDRVRLGITAPKEIPVHRREIYDEIKREKESKKEKGKDCKNGKGKEEGDGVGPKEASEKGKSSEGKKF